MPERPYICVFCGSSPGRDPAFVASADELGRTLAARGITVVYGGGSAGLMGALAAGALDAGGHVIGILPSGLFPDGVTASPLRTPSAGEGSWSRTRPSGTSRLCRGAAVTSVSRKAIAIIVNIVSLVTDTPSRS